MIETPQTVNKSTGTTNPKQQQDMMSEKYLSFSLNDESYGIPTKHTLEVIHNNIIITRVPKTPKYLSGIINLRGKIIPVIDLKYKFSLDHTKKANCIIITQITSKDNELITLGFGADNVTGVFMADESEIETIPSDTPSTQCYIKGILKRSGILYTLLDIQELTEGIKLTEGNE